MQLAINTLPIASNYIDKKIIKLKSEGRTYSYNNSILCYHSRGECLNLNGKVIAFNGKPSDYEKNFFNENNTPIVCRHLALAYIQTNDKPKVFFNSISSEDRLKNNSFFFRDQFEIYQKTKNANFAYHFHAHKFQLIITDLIKKNWDNRGYKEKFFFISWGHCMVLRIKNKNKNTAVLYFYDPNDTMRHQKYVISNSNDFLTLTIDKLLPNNRLDAYFPINLPYASIFSHQATKKPNITISEELSPMIFYRLCCLGHYSLLNLDNIICKKADKYNYYGATKDGVPVINQLFKNNRAECLKKVINDILSSDFSIDEKVHLLEAQNILGVTGFFIALNKNNIEVVKVFINLILASKLPSESKVRLLMAINETTNTNSGLFNACYNNSIEIITVFLDFIINSKLEIKDKKILLNSIDKDDCKCMFLSCANNYDKVLEILLYYIVYSSLDDTTKIELIESIAINGYTAMYVLFYNNYAECLKIMMQIILSSNLSNENKVYLLSGKNKNNQCGFHLAVNKKNKEVINVYREEIINSKLSDLDKNFLLHAENQHGECDFYKIIK